MRWALIVTMVAATLQPTTAPPDTEIFLATLSMRDGGLTVEAPVNITNSPGYDNQPSFAPDGRAVFFTSMRGGGQTDIYRYTTADRLLARVTDTAESEYSPTVTPDGAHLSVIRVEADGTQRLWQFAIDGGHPELLLADLKPVGYHAWADDHTLVLFVLGQPATLHVADTRTKKAELLVHGINRSIQPIPGGATVSFVQRLPPVQEGGAATLRISELDPHSRRVAPLVDAVRGASEADCAWTPDGMLLMSDKDVLYGWRRGDGDWRRLADFGALGLHGVSRIAVSPAGDRLAIVTQAAR